MTPLPYEYLSTKGEVGQAWGVWLSGLADWDWWVTLTFRDPPAEALARGWTRPGWSYAKGGWRDFVGAVRPALGPLAWVRGFEIQKWRGAPHIHALVGGLDDTRYAPVGLWWWNKYGMCHIEEYNAELGAGYYLCKYVSKGLADLAFSDMMPGKMS